MTPEVLARLTASSLRHDNDGAGGIPIHTREEIAGALANISPGAVYYAHVIYMGDSAYQSDLVAAIMVELSGKESVREWKDSKPGVLLGMARIGVYEHLPQSTVCRVCKGQCDTVVNGKKIVCERCEGSGRERVSGRQKCRILNDAIHETSQEISRRKNIEYVDNRIHPDTWYKKWRGRYEASVPPILGRWNDEIWASLGRGLKLEHNIL